MEETENGVLQGWKLANEISGFVPEVALRKDWIRIGFVGKIGREVLWSRGFEGVVGREVSEEGCGVCEGYLGCQYRWGGKAADGIDLFGCGVYGVFDEWGLIWRDADIREGYPMKAGSGEKGRR